MIRVGVLFIYNNGDVAFGATFAGIPIPVGTLLNSVTPKSLRDISQTTQSPAEGDAAHLSNLLPVVLGCLNNLRKKIVVKHLYVTHIVGSDNPYSAAMISGMINEAVGMALPLANKWFNIKRSFVSIVPNFTNESSALAIKCGASIRIGQLINILLSTHIQYLQLRKDEKNAKASIRGIDGGNSEKTA